MTSATVEKLPHVDDARMRWITPDGLRAALAPEYAGIDLRTHLAARSAVVPAKDPLRWAELNRGTERAARRIAEAEVLLDTDVDFCDPAHGRSGLYAFHYLGWTDPLIDAAALTGDERYVRRYADIIDLWWDSRDHVVGEWPGLDVVWYTLGIACRSQVLLRALHVLGSRPAFDAASWHRLVATLLGGARWLAEEHDAFRHGNWQLAGCATLGEIAAYLPEFSEAEHWRRVARERLVEHLELDVYADGGHYERSPSYHAGCLGGLQNAAANDPVIRDHPRLRAMHEWLLAMAMPDGVVPPFNDSHLLYAGNALLRGWHVYGEERYLAAARRWLGADQIAETLAWLPFRPLPPVESSAGGRSASGTSSDGRGSVWLSTSKFAVLRADDHQATVNCGPYIDHELESHSHHTALDLVLWAHGAPVAWEAGGPATYDDPAYQSWFRSTRAHNTIVVGDPDASMSTDHDATVERCEFGRHTDMLVASHRGWGGRHRRMVLFARDQPRYWVVRDTYDDAPFTWWLHGLAPWIATRHGFHTGPGPGLLVLAATTPGRVDTDAGSGPTRLPGVGGRDELATAHGLGLRYPAGTVTHVLVPYADEPPPPPLHLVEMHRSPDEECP